MSDPHCPSCGAAQELLGTQCICACHNWEHRDCDCGGIRIPTAMKMGSGGYVVFRAVCNGCQTVWINPSVSVMESFRDI